MKKSDYARSTMECKFDALKPAFINELKTFATKHKLGSVENEVINCFETMNIKKGFLGRKQTSYTQICVTKEFLFWDVITDKYKPGVAAAKWTDISEIWNWEETEFGKMIEDHGLEIFGFTYLASERGRWFIGLGNDAAGAKCSQIIKSMINAK